MKIWTAAESTGNIVGITNGMFVSGYGVSLNTIAFSQGKGIGLQLFNHKIESLYKEKGKVVAKPESLGDLKLTLRAGFVKSPELDHLIPWEGDAYLLR